MCVQVLVVNPAFFKYVNDRWTEHHGRYPSTGMLAIIFALHICDQVGHWQWLRPLLARCTSLSASVKTVIHFRVPAENGEETLHMSTQRSLNGQIHFIYMCLIMERLLGNGKYLKIFCQVALGRLSDRKSIHF